MARYRCKKCGYAGDRLIFPFTDFSYCTASNDNDTEYIGPAPEWVTAGGAEIGEPVGCPECRNWGVSEFELTEDGNAERVAQHLRCAKILKGENHEEDQKER